MAVSITPVGLYSATSNIKMFKMFKCQIGEWNGGEPYSLQHIPFMFSSYSNDVYFETIHYFLNHLNHCLSTPFPHSRTSHDTMHKMPYQITLDNGLIAIGAKN